MPMCMSYAHVHVLCSCICTTYIHTCGYTRMSQIEDIYMSFCLAAFHTLHISLGLCVYACMYICVERERPRAHARLHKVEAYLSLSHPLSRRVGGAEAEWKGGCGNLQANRGGLDSVAILKTRLPLQLRMCVCCVGAKRCCQWIKHALLVPLCAYVHKMWRVLWERKEAFWPMHASKSQQHTHMLPPIPTSTHERERLKARDT